MVFSVENAVSGAKHATSQISQLTHSRRQRIVLALSRYLVGQSDNILAANALDIADARESGLSEGETDVLRLDAPSLTLLAERLSEIAAQPDILYQIDTFRQLNNGMRVGSMRIPLGVIAMVFDSQPTLSLIGAALALKSGNALVLRGTRYCRHTNLALLGCVHHVLKQEQIDVAAVALVCEADKATLTSLVSQKNSLDLIIAHGTEGLIDYVQQYSHVPVIAHKNGTCHQYIDGLANIDTAMLLLQNGKLRHARAGYTIETCLIHRDIAACIVPKIVSWADSAGIELHVCEKAREFAATALDARASHWQQREGAGQLNIKLVADVDCAIAHIEQFGSRHTELIVTESLANANTFMNAVNAAVVMVNASPCFATGEGLALGGDLAFSTDKLHVSGPVSMRALTTEKWVVLGDGQICE